MTDTKPLNDGAAATPVRELIERLVRDVKAGAIIGYDGPQEYWSRRMGAEASAGIARLLEAALSRPIDPKAEAEPIGYVTAIELTQLRLGASCVDLFGKVVPKGTEMVPVYASPSIVAPVGVKPKPLEWEECTQARSEADPHREVVGYEAASPAGIFYGIRIEYDGFHASSENDHLGRFDDLDAAKAAAQSDHDERILSALTPAEKAGVGDGELPPLAPIRRGTDATWEQVIKLFRKHHLPDPPTSLRDELVIALEWAWFGYEGSKR